MRTTFMPSWADRRAHAYPPLPPPKMTTSNCSATCYSQISRISTHGVILPPISAPAGRFRQPNEGANGHTGPADRGVPVWSGGVEGWTCNI
ncbi:unannotated protein [freshwater metagenome]|uniref:Unannotated protein n=1 Tax=freshwater metagenome TaxID=449393 RepID=A0A6J7BAD0_9ZZZZ